MEKMSFVMNGVLLGAGVFAGKLIYNEIKWYFEEKAEKREARKQQIYTEARVDRHWKPYFEGKAHVINHEETEERR